MRNRRVEEHLQLVRPMALSFARRSGQCGEDLTQVGMLGLIKTSTFYKNGSSVPFEAFARPHISGAIVHYLRDRTVLIRLPAALRSWPSNSAGSRSISWMSGSS